MLTSNRDQRILLQRMCSRILSLSRGVPLTVGKRPLLDTDSLRTVYIEMNKRYAGHAHWQNIKSTKQAGDLRKGQNSNRIVTLIKSAVRQGNGNIDPKVNRALGEVVTLARKLNVTQELINRTLTRIKNHVARDYWSYYGFKDIGGSIIMIHAFTDDKTALTKEFWANIKDMRVIHLNESVKSQFQCTGQIIAEPPPGVADPEERAMEDAIEFNAEEVTVHERDPLKLLFTTGPSEVHLIGSKLGGRQYNVISCLEEYTPYSTISLSEEQKQRADDAITRIQDITDVVNVYDNLDWEN